MNEQAPASSGGLGRQRDPQIVAAPACHHGEGPVWDERSSLLHWLDLDAGIVHHLAGSMSYEAEPYAGTLYRLEFDGNVSSLLEGVTIPSGPDWSPDGSVLYFTDSARQQVTSFLYDRAPTPCQAYLPLPLSPKEPPRADHRH